MQITLKKTLIAGVGFLSALFFFLIVCLPVSRTVTILGVTQTESGSLLSILSGNEAALAMVRNQFNLADFLKDNPTEGLKIYEQAVDAMTSVYKAFAVMGIVLFVLSTLACIGAFFMKKPRGARLLTIPFLVIDIILSLVVMIFTILLTATTDMAIKGAEVSVSVPTVWMYIIGIVLFIGMLISSGVVKEVVFVGKKEK